MTIDEFRARFPILRQRVDVNSCSQGALSVDGEDALKAFVQLWHAHRSPWDRWIEVDAVLAALDSETDLLVKS